MTEHRGAPPPEQRKLVDPLGEIERLARELLRADPSPRPGASWEDYWSAAEAQMVAGKSAAARSDRSRKSTERTMSPEFTALLADCHEPMVAAFCRAFLAPLSHHDTISLGRILSDATMRMNDGGSSGPCDRGEAARVLAELAGEYDEAFLRNHGRPMPRALPAEVRAAYWVEELNAVFAADEPLTYADQNTIRRLCDALLAEGTVVKIDFR